MHKFETFISGEYRPEVRGGKLDKDHITRFTLGNDNFNKKTLNVNAICFGPKKDNVLINLENSIYNRDKILILYYEDIHARWSYITNNNDSYFIYKMNEIDEYIVKPNNLYVRGCYIEPDDKYWSVLGDFYNFIDMWRGKVLCRPKTQLSNESKLFQLNNSLRQAKQQLGSIKIGKSYVIKGKCPDFILRDSKKYIVKSLSGIRSIVVDGADYLNWDFSSINNLPVLFQDKVQGNDIRAHVLNDKIYVKLSVSKSEVDYRYDDNFFNLIDIEKPNSDLVNFCINVTKNEGNNLMGVDFLKSDNGYVVLEANPSPGWSAYHNSTGVDVDPFIVDLLRELKSV